MPIDVKVPSVGESISSGILASWLVKDGDSVEKDQNLYEFETDKITTEVPAEGSGRISLKAGEGDEIEVGQVIATIDESAAGDSGEAEPDTETSKTADEGEEDGSDDDRGGADDDGGNEDGSGEDERKEDDSGEDSGGEEDAGEEDDGGEDDEREEDARDDDGDGDSSETAKGSARRDELPETTSPSVRRKAREAGIDPADVEGSGKGGRVTGEDVAAAIKQRAKTKEDESKEKPESPGTGDSSEASAQPASGEPSGESERTKRRKLTPLRRRIAERLVHAQRTAAILTTFNECDLSAVMDLRKKHQEAFTERHGVKLGFMSFFVKATIQALQAVPAINAQLDGDVLIENQFYDIGVAMSTKRGLLVPVIRDADRLSFAGIEQQILQYGTKAQEGKIGIDDLQGGVFTISNGGIFGSMLSTPILNPPQSGILGMHTIQERPVARNGEVVIRPMMYLALSYDHRIVDGREAVTFLVKVKEAIEDPARLLFGI